MEVAHGRMRPDGGSNLTESALTRAGPRGYPWSRKIEISWIDRGGVERRQALTRTSESATQSDTQNAEEVLRSRLVRRHMGKVQLIFTSPPFPLNRKKKYGNLTGNEYIDWLADFAPIFRDYLKPDGSIVVELGNAWERGNPVMSTLALRALLVFLERGGLHLCEQFVAYNTARLPSPAQWVNIERIRVKDAFTHIWWMSPSPRPKADNRRVLIPYSSAMLKLLSDQKYDSGKRPSEHNIGKSSFLRDNKGAIPSNVLKLRNLLAVANTSATDPYLDFCRSRGLPFQPSRMPKELPEFFIRFLTEPGDLVLDPFAGSNTTGAVAEALRRRWVSIEAKEAYVLGSRGRFPQRTNAARSNRLRRRIRTR